MTTAIEVNETNLEDQVSYEDAIAAGCPILIALLDEVNAKRKLPTLTPEQIDDAINEYESSEKALEVEEKGHKELKKTLIAVVKAQGTVPPHAEQSRRLMGKRGVATVTTGTTINVNEDAVSVLCEYLTQQVGADRGVDIFQRLFAANIKHQLVDGARSVLAALQLPKRTHEKVLSLFGRCIDPRPKAPSLKVELIVPEKPARKPRAAKAVA